MKSLKDERALLNVWLAEWGTFRTCPVDGTNVVINNFGVIVNLPEVPVHQRVLVSADRLCASVAAASVIAKVARDRLMEEYDLLYPGYEFASNKGYAAPEHRAGLDALGLCPIHRVSFAPCRDRQQMSLWQDASADAAEDPDEADEDLLAVELAE